MENTGIYLHEIQDQLRDLFGVTVSASMICRTLLIMGCCRRVIHHVVLQTSDELRAHFMAVFDPVWIDESGCNKHNCMRKFAYTLQGIPTVDHCLLARGTCYSAITAVSVKGIEDILVEGNVNGESFVKDSLVLSLQPINCCNLYSVVVMDNASIHHVDRVAELIIQTGALLLFLPP